MENYEKLEIKLDTMNETMRSMLDLNRQTLTEIKKQNDVFGLKLEILEKNINKIAADLYEHIKGDTSFTEIFGKWSMRVIVVATGLAAMYLLSRLPQIIDALER
ncbi:hypothetical protein FACS1894187_06320 [Synergistales bacterium]|nr:hypothetical protein FACS1894187_06320 [Synergistales bacterium]